MIIKYTPPPEHIYKRYQDKFGVKFEDGVIFPYDDTVYVKSELPDHLIVHEQVHLDQQKDIGKDVWIDKYMDDVDFRLEQEIEAYKAQYLFFKKTRKDRNLVARFLHVIAGDLSGSMYNNIISYKEATKAIKS